MRIEFGCNVTRQKYSNVYINFILNDVDKKL